MLLPFSLRPHHPSPFLNGGASALWSIPKADSPVPWQPQPAAPLRIEAMKKMQGRVVSAMNDKTVAVEVVRLAPHPKYKRRVRIKKRYQAHDPLNQFKVGDFVQLDRSRPISKTKTFVAVPVTARNVPKADANVNADIGIPVSPPPPPAVEEEMESESAPVE